MAILADQVNADVDALMASLPRGPMLALSVFVTSIIVLRVFKYIIVSRLKRIAARTQTEYDDLVIEIVDSVGWTFYVLLSLFFAVHSLKLDTDSAAVGAAVGAVNYALIVVGIFYAVKAIQTLVDFGARKLIKSQEEAAFLCTWGKLQGDDGPNLRAFLADSLMLDWADEAEIEASGDGRTVRLASGERHVELALDQGRRKVLVKASNGKSCVLRAQEEEGRLDLFIEGKALDSAVIVLMSRIAKGVVWVFAVTLILSNLGYEVSTLVAGLGISGLAVAIALQSVLGDVFASFTIFFDKPFQVGDYIEFAGDSGTVKDIGIKSTRIQTLQGQELVVSNKQLTESKVHNYKKLEKRRVVFSFGVRYDTPAERLRRVPLMVREIVTAVEQAELVRVHFARFGESSLIFDVVYYVNSDSYQRYMDVQQEINLGIVERFEREGVQMAYPTHTVHIERSGGGAAGAMAEPADL